MAELKTCAQSGEDRLIWEYFERTSQGFFAEIGVNDPEIGSKTYLLEEHGWHGVLVEPQPACYERLRFRRPNSQVFRAACGSLSQRGWMVLGIARVESKSWPIKGPASVASSSNAIEVDVMTLDEVLAATHCPGLDFLAVNAGRTGLDVLKGLDLKRYWPKLILIKDQLLTLAVDRHLRACRYKAVKRTGINNWYVPAGARFAFSNLKERVKLFRKIRLGTPFRHTKRRLRGRKS
ncbi:MAG TPA: FkbM family methyltransferase [Verrucomicrobiae bacterium]|nr:FkbM family methyltransferase [Verrucomicrobiae bacterium]